MTIKQFLNLPPSEVAKLTVKELRGIVRETTGRVQASVGRLQSAGVASRSSAIAGLPENYKPLSSRAKKTELIERLLVNREYLRNPTSTITGTRKDMQRAERRHKKFTGFSGRGPRYWRTYRQYVQARPDVLQNHGSDVLQRMLEEYFTEADQRVSVDTNIRGFDAYVTSQELGPEAAEELAATYARRATDRAADGGEYAPEGGYDPWL